MITSKQCKGVKYVTTAHALHAFFSWTSTFILASVKISCSFFVPVLSERLRNGIVWDRSYGEGISVLLLMKSPCKREDGNCFNPFAVAVCNGDIVGHVPRKISSVCSLYIRRGGEIHCRVTSSRRFSADLEQEGLEVPIVCARVV